MVGSHVIRKSNRVVDPYYWQPIGKDELTEKVQATVVSFGYNGSWSEQYLDNEVKVLNRKHSIETAGLADSIISVTDDLNKLRSFTVMIEKNVNRIQQEILTRINTEVGKVRQRIEAVEQSLKPVNEAPPPEREIAGPSKMGLLQIARAIKREISYGHEMDTYIVSRLCDRLEEIQSELES